MKERSDWQLVASSFVYVLGPTVHWA